jgi:hypothetical protein
VVYIRPSDSMSLLLGHGLFPFHFRVMEIFIVVLSLCATLSCYFAAKITKKKSTTLDHIPRLNIPGATTFKEKQDRYIKNAADLLNEGYEKVICP